MNLLAKDHNGMSVSARGILMRNHEGINWAREELLKNAEEMAAEYYKGNITVVDEFLQLYCIGEDARKAAKARMVDA